MNTYEKARAFIYRNARPVDLARWQYHFENGSKDAVLNALYYYQNEDGGFGHAMEADSWNPNSSPIHTWCATEILREINMTDSKHPIIKGILRYLDSGKDFNGIHWNYVVISNNDYPHAPWWHTESESTCHNDYNPTACLAGFIIRFADKDSNLYKKGCCIAKEAFDSYMKQELLDDMHTALCFIRMAEYIFEAGEKDIIDIQLLQEKLIEQVKYSITKNTDEWMTSYCCKPSQFINSAESIFYKNNKQLTDYECDFIVKSQLEDGSWNIPWSWEMYPEEWAISKNWWKSNMIIVNMLYLRNLGK